MTIQIDKKIVGFEVARDDKPAAEVDATPSPAARGHLRARSST
jgi:hypothetical protein